jgi:hypothetical protein
MYGLQDCCSDDRALDALVGSEVLSYRRFTNFLRFYTRTHTHTHTHIGTSVFKSRANAAFLSLQRLWFDLCPFSGGSVMVKVAFVDFFFEYLGFLLLMMHTVLHLNMAYSSTWEIRTVRGRGGPDYPRIRITEGWLSDVRTCKNRHSELSYSLWKPKYYV